VERTGSISVSSFATRAIGVLSRKTLVYSYSLASCGWDWCEDFWDKKKRFFVQFYFKKVSHAHVQMVDYSKWDTLKYSSSSSEEDEDEGEKVAGITRSALPLKNLSLSSSSSSSPIWTGLVLHHKDIFVSHVIPKLNETDRCFFSKVNRESRDVLAYAGVNVSELKWAVYECLSISTLEWVWNDMPWGKKDRDGEVIDQAWFCAQVVFTNKLEFLKWAREVKQCEWDEWTINIAARTGNLEMLKYCFSNGCPCDKKASCKQAAWKGHLDCLRFLFDKVKPSRDTEKEVTNQAACGGHVEILKYLVEERKIPYIIKCACMFNAAKNGQIDSLKYFVEEAKMPLNHWRHIAEARYKEHPECENYLLEKGCPEPTDEEYARFVEEEEQQEELLGTV